MKPEQQFWMVWNLEGRSPSVAHPNKDSAEREAERLANANPGQRFYVVKGLRYFETVKPVRRVELPCIPADPF